MNIFRIISSIIAIAVVFTLMGCAKFPSTPPTTGKQLVITLKVNGTINPIDQTDSGIKRHYFVAIDNDGDPNTGPQAAIFPPYGGTGWVTSERAAESIGVTSYIQYDFANPGGFVYNIRPNSFFLTIESAQPPIRTEYLEGGSTIRFVVDFSQIATAAIPADQIQQLDINFITTNALPTNNEPVFGREWDALGPSGQDYVTIDTRSDRLYSGENEDGHVVTDPDLDIIYWSIEVQTVSSR